MQSIAHIVLNFSFFLYLFFYIPQLIHNFRYRRVRELSLHYHALLLLAAMADLYYGFGRISQWQYRCVSVITACCLILQHAHLCYVYRHDSRARRYLLLLTGLVLAMVVGLYCSLYVVATPLLVFVMMGWVERIGYLFYSLPQLLKNRSQGSGAAINTWFVLIGMITAMCDAFCAWVFHWGPSSLWGAPLAMVLHGVLFWQCRHSNFEATHSIKAV